MLSYSEMLSKAFKRSLWQLVKPQCLYRAFKLQRNRKKQIRALDDPQLQLYANILQNDFLHYGYFKDPTLDPATISLRDIQQAQSDYADLILQRIKPTATTVLDVGCGMGGLSALLQQRGLTSYALTPDQRQIHYLQQKHHDIQTIQSRFEDINSEMYQAKFDTVITAESLQYLDLDKTLPLMQKVLKPKGQWIICDYFRKTKAFEASGHQWDAFDASLQKHNFKITSKQDITPNVAVTLRYLQLLGERVGVPFIQFLQHKFKNKQPGFYYLTQPLAEKLDGMCEHGMTLVSPERFLDEKRYMLLVVEPC